MPGSRGQALQLTAKSGSALGGANDRTNAGAFEPSATLHGRHREIQLRSAALSRQRDPDRMKECPTLAAGALPHTVCRGTETFAIEPRRALQFFSKRSDHVAGARLVKHLRDVGPLQRLAGIELEKKSQAVGDLFEAVPVLVEEIKKARG